MQLEPKLNVVIWTTLTYNIDIDPCPSFIVRVDIGVIESAAAQLNF